MSELRTVEDVRQYLAEYDAAHPYWYEEGVEARAQIKKRELAEAEKQRQQAHKAREAEKQQAASTDWWAAIDKRIDWWFDYYFCGTRRNGEHGSRGLYADAIGGVMGQIRAQLRGEFKHAIEEQQRSFEAKLAALEERQAALVSGVDGRIEATLARERDVLIAATGGAQLRAELRRAFNELTDAFGAQIAALEERVKAVPGKLPVSKIWRSESVTYEGEVVSYDGALYQARKDTAQAPGGSDWVCVARAGRDGLTPNVRGTFNAHKTYARLDVIAFDGSSYIARRDNPGICPGDGWQALASRGRVGEKGPPGPTGKKGEKGEKGDSSEIVGWHLDRKTYRAVPVLAGGKLGPELPLRPLFEQFVEDTR